MTSSFSFDAANRLTTLTHQVAGGSGLATYGYGYDNADRLTSEQNAEGTVTYGYDNTNQLTGASGSRAETYTYDSGGNRTMAGYTTGAGNELTAAPGATYAYDNAGNLSAQTNTTTHVTTSYTYDYHNRLTGVTVGGTAAATGAIAPMPGIMRPFWGISSRNPSESAFREASSIASATDALPTTRRLTR